VHPQYRRTAADKVKLGFPGAAPKATPKGVLASIRRYFTPDRRIPRSSSLIRSGDLIVISLFPDE